jgi:hypothetical protein
LDWFSEVGVGFGFVVKLPDEDGSVPRGSDQHLSVFILLLGVSCLNGSDPIGVSFEVSDFLGKDSGFFSHHKLIF